MADSDEALLAELKRDDRRRGVKILAIMGAVLLLVGVGVLALGLTFEEPAERLATKPVPHGFELVLIVIGALVMAGGLGLLVQAVRTARNK